MGRLTVWMTTQAPHAIRTVFALVSGLPEQSSFGSTPTGTSAAASAARCQSTRLRRGGGRGVEEGSGKPVKWVEDRMDNLMSSSFARDYHISGYIGATKDGKLTGLKVKTIADHGYADAAARIRRSSPRACSTSSRAPIRSARRSSRWTASTRTSHRRDRLPVLLPGDRGGLLDRAAGGRGIARKVGMTGGVPDEELHPAEAFPYHSALGWTYDSGNYAGALKLAMEMIDYPALRREQAEKRKNGEFMGIGISSFTEIVGAGPSAQFDILGIKMFESCEIRIHPTGKVMARFGTNSQGQGHEQPRTRRILATELGIPAENISIEEGDTDTAPYGLGTYASRSTPTAPAGAAAAIAARKIRDKAQKIAAHMLEVSPDDLDWKDYKFQVKGVPEKSKTMADVAFAVYTTTTPARRPDSKRSITTTRPT